MYMRIFRNSAISTAKMEVNDESVEITMNDGSDPTIIVITKEDIRKLFNFIIHSE